jgi:hypothetical protein
MLIVICAALTVRAELKFLGSLIAIIESKFRKRPESLVKRKLGLTPLMRWTANVFQQAAEAFLVTYWIEVAGE